MQYISDRAVTVPKVIITLTFASLHVTAFHPLENYIYWYPVLSSTLFPSFFFIPLCQHLFENSITPAPHPAIIPYTPILFSSQNHKAKCDQFQLAFDFLLHRRSSISNHHVDLNKNVSTCILTHLCKRIWYYFWFWWWAFIREMRLNESAKRMVKSLSTTGV